MPDSGAKIGRSQSNLITSVEPSAVAPSPTSWAPLARKVAHPSVVPAASGMPTGSPRALAGAEAKVPMGVPTGTTAGSQTGSRPNSFNHAGQTRATGS